MPTLPNFRVESRQCEEGRNITLVRQLWKNREWNLLMLKAYFSPLEVNEIHKIHIPFFNLMTVINRCGNFQEMVDIQLRVHITALFKTSSEIKPHHLSCRVNLIGRRFGMLTSHKISKSSYGGL